MKLLTTAVLAAAPADITVRAWYSLSSDDQRTSLADAVTRITSDVAKTDPGLARKIRDCYSDRNSATNGTAKLLYWLRLRHIFLNEHPDAPEQTILDFVWDITSNKFMLPPRTNLNADHRTWL